MILAISTNIGTSDGKPRASGDDPILAKNRAIDSM